MPASGSARSPTSSTRCWFRWPSRCCSLRFSRMPAERLRRPIRQAHGATAPRSRQSVGPPIHAGGLSVLDAGSVALLCASGKVRPGRRHLGKKLLGLRVTDMEAKADSASRGPPREAYRCSWPLLPLGIHHLHPGGLHQQTPGPARSHYPLSGGAQHLRPLAPGLLTFRSRQVPRLHRRASRCARPPPARPAENGAPSAGRRAGAVPFSTTARKSPG